MFCDETLSGRIRASGAIALRDASLSFQTLRSVVKQAYGVEASAAARDGPERVQKPTNKRARGAAHREVGVTRPVRADSRERLAT